MAPMASAVRSVTAGPAVDKAPEPVSHSYSWLPLVPEFGGVADLPAGPRLGFPGGEDHGSGDGDARGVVPRGAAAPQDGQLHFANLFCIHRHDAKRHRERRHSVNASGRLVLVGFSVAGRVFATTAFDAHMVSTGARRVRYVRSAIPPQAHQWPETCPESLTELNQRQRNSLLVQLFLQQTRSSSGHRRSREHQGSRESRQYPARRTHNPLSPQESYADTPCLTQTSYGARSRLLRSASPCSGVQKCDLTCQTPATLPTMTSAVRSVRDDKSKPHQTGALPKCRAPAPAQGFPYADADEYRADGRNALVEAEIPKRVLGTGMRAACLACSARSSRFLNALSAGFAAFHAFAVLQVAVNRRWGRATQCADRRSFRVVARC